MSTKGSTVGVQQFLSLISLDVDLECESKFDLSQKNIETLPVSLGTLLPAARRIDLSENPISDLTPLNTVRYLTQLVLAHCNRLNLSTLRSSTLVVLSIANCGISSLEGLEACKGSLKTLVANDNKIQLLSTEEESSSQHPLHKTARRNYEIISSLTLCQTVIMSRNKEICALSQVAGSPSSSEAMDSKERQALANKHPLSVFEKLPELKKLSLSDCGIVNLPERWFLPYITELRLAQNLLSSFQPDGVILRSVKILDVSNNRIEDVNTLRRCKFVRQLYIKGNPFQPSSDGEPMEGASLARVLSRMFEHLEVVDGHPLSSLMKKNTPRTIPSEGISQPVEEEKDVVVDLPVPEATPAPSVVKRQRVLSEETTKKLAVTGGEAVSQWKKRKESSAW